MTDEDKELYSGLIRLHVLHHAAEDAIYGGWIIEELRGHGYAISPGTLYPLLHGLERKGYLTSRQEGKGKRSRRFYAITPKGRDALADAKVKVKELFGELSSQSGSAIKRPRDARAQQKGRVRTNP